MKAFITTVAGVASRFSKDFDQPQVKCIYNDGDPHKTLLYRLLTLAGDYDRLVVVGGFMFDRLKRYIESTVSDELRAKIILVENKFYREYGSGYSLYVGLSALNDGNKYDEILFAEGDLFFDSESFLKIKSIDGDVVSVNSETISADRSVAFYIDESNRINYIYDVLHGCLEIKTPFKAIYNSAQIWKFSDCGLLLELSDELGDTGSQRTNLVLINSYFGSQKRKGNINFVFMKEWINCNTLADFRRAEF